MLGLGLAGTLAPGVAPVGAQVLQQWSHQAAVGDASAAIAVGDTLMFVADNEDEILRLFARHPGAACAAPVYTFDARPSLAPAPSNPEADLEAAVLTAGGGGTRIYWLASHSNSRTGNLRPNRYRLFATQLNGNGTGSPPYTLSYLGRYDHLRTDLIAWDANNLHGLGAHYFGLQASAAAGVLPSVVEGFNIEGMTIAPDGVTALIAFRAPLVNPFGPTTSPAQRTHALIVPLINLAALVTGSPTPGPGAAQFGTPFVLDLGGRGVRSIDVSGPGQYLITAGPAGDASNPPAAPLDFRLFTWSGHAGPQPMEHTTSFAHGWDPEGAIVPPGVINNLTVVQFVSDDNTPCFRSFTAAVGAPAATTGVSPAPPAHPGIRFSRPPAPNPARESVSFAIALPDSRWVDVSVDDVEGRRVATLWAGMLAAGEHPFAWNGTLRSGVRARAGMYTATFRAGEVTVARRFALLR